MSRSAPADNGVALIVVMLALSLLMGLGLALVLVTMTESTIAGSHLQATQTFYAAEAAVEFAIAELGAMPDWAPVLAGKGGSTLRDPAVLNVVAPDDQSRMWARFAYGRLQDLIAPGLMPVPFVLGVWVASIPLQEDALAVLGHAYGPNGSRRAIEALVARPGDDSGRLRLLGWREVR